MPRFLIARVVIILLNLIVIYYGIAGLQTGEIRSRGYKFDRDSNPLGYWFTVFVTLVGPAAIVYLMLTK